MNWYYKNKYYIKDVPREFLKIENLGDFLEDFDKKRLTDRERENLRGELLRIHLQEFVDARLKDYRLKPYIAGASPAIVLRIHTKHSDYCAVRFDNGAEVRCPKSLFREAPVREEITRLY